MITLLNSLRNPRGLALVCLTVTLLATAVEAQQKILWQGAVKLEAINVYQSASTSESVTTVLRQGNVVNVVLEINVMGDAWCRVALPGQSESLGFVLCFNLERNHYAPKQIAHGEPVTIQKVSEPTVVNSATLSNKDILDMNKAGLPAEILVAKIKSSQCNFDTSPSQLRVEKEAGADFDVWKWSVDSLRAEKLVDKCGNFTDIDPGGHYLLGAVNFGEKTGIYEVSISDKKCISLLPGVPTLGVVFAPDGKSFLYAPAARREVAIYRQRWSDGKLIGAPQVALKVPFVFHLEYQGNAYDFSRDLSTIVYARPGGHADLYLLSQK